MRNFGHTETNGLLGGKGNVWRHSTPDDTWFDSAIVMESAFKCKQSENSWAIIDAVKIVTILSRKDSLIK